MYNWLDIVSVDVDCSYCTVLSLCFGCVVIPSVSSVVVSIITAILCMMSQDGEREREMKNCDNNYCVVLVGSNTMQVVVISRCPDQAVNS